MPVYDSYETYEVPRDHRSRREPRYEAQPQYKEVHETRYIPRDDIIRRDDVVRHDSFDSVQEIDREFPPPAGAVIPRQQYGAPMRSRSAERDSRRYRGEPRYGRYEDERDYNPRDRHGDGYLAVKEEKISRRRSLSRNQKIASAVGGAALAIGAKELVDYQKSKRNPESPRERNLAMNAAVGAAGAFAGWEGAQVYEKAKEKRDKKELKYTREIEYDRDGHVVDYEEDVRESRPKPSRRKSIVETAMGLAGLGAGAKALGGRDSSRDRTRGRRDSYSDDDRSRKHRSRSRSNENMAKFQAAAKAALLAGATEAYRLRKEPGGWDGAKAKRILTAAGTAGAVGGAVSRGDDDGKSKRHLMEAVIGGLAGTKAVHGSRKELDVDDDGRSIRDRSRSRSRFSRDRSRSRGGGGASAIPIAALATGAMGLLAKKAHSRSRSRSRTGRRRRDSSEDSYRSHGKRSRSKSVTDFARKGIAALGLGGAAAAAGRSRSRSRDREVIEKTTIRKERRRRDDSRDRGYKSSDDEYDRRRIPRSRGISRDRDSDYDDRRSNRDSARGSGGRNR